MKRSLSLLAVAVVFLVAWPAHADEPLEVQLEFVRKLRTRHYSNLALEYLEKLSKTAPPEMAPLLHLETARTKISLAQEKEPEQRAPLFALARSELEAFIKANGEHPEAAPARVEVARLAALQGKALLSVALRQETQGAQIAGALKARQQFIDAGKELEAAAKQLAALKAKYAGAKAQPETRAKEKVDESYLQVLLDRATNYLDQAETYIDEASDKTVRARVDVIEQAKKQLGKLADLDTRASERTLARAWLVRCYQLTDAPQDATKQFQRVMAETGSNAKPGQRLAWYFQIRGLNRDPSFKKDKNKAIVKEATGWLTAFPAYRNTAQGQAVRFELAQAQVAEAQGLKGDAATKLLGPAQKELALLAASDSELAPQARELHLTLSVARVKDLPLAKIATFDDCYLKARYEMVLLQKVAGKLDKTSGAARAKLEEERKAHLKNILTALQQALRLADDKTSPPQLAEARSYLTFVYLVSGDPYRAAVMGEDAARAVPATKRSAAAAGYALEGYASILGEPNGNTDSNRDRLRKLADFILKDRAKLWSGEPVTTQARYQLAMVNLREKKYAETIDALEQLPADFGGYVYAQSQLAITAVAAAKEAKTDAERKALQDRALKALQRIPTLPPHPNAATAQMFFAAQLEQGDLLYAAAATRLQKGEVAEAIKNFEAMAKFTTGLLHQFEKADVKLSPEVHGKLAYALTNLNKAARYGLANTEYRAGHYDKVLALTADAVKAVKDLDKGNGPIVMKDYKVTGNLLGLNLRAKVQGGAVAEAKDLLPLLRRLQGEDDLENDTTAVLQSLVQDLRAQTKALQEKGDPAQLKSMVDNFSAFLEELSKQPGQKGMLQNLFFLANCYGSLGRHDKAAALYAQIEEPKSDKGGPNDKEVATYWYVQLQRAKELRLAGKELLQATMAPDAAKMFAEARNVVAKIPAPFRSFSVQQEEIFQLEDQRLYGTAITRWAALMKSPYLVKQVATDNEAKKLYFDCFYHSIYCWYEYGKNHKVPAKQTEYIRKAADYIVRLESARNQDGWQLLGDRLRELLRTEAPLRAQYDALKKAAP